MPARRDLYTILVIGSGPIVIGQACEFDYSGTQACKVLRDLGYRVVLVNSNPATIMTDPEFSDATYLEPITPSSVLAVIERERPDALLPTLGGQTALNVSVTLAAAGSLEAHGVRLIGASVEAIRRAEDRRLFVETMRDAGLPLPRSAFAHSVEDAMAGANGLGLPVIVRPSFVLGGGGSGLAASPEELVRLARDGLAASPIGEVLIEESVAGWKEFELEVMRDRADNAVVVCSIENVDPMGVHTGDSITVAPAQTLSDREYQRMRDYGLCCIRAVGVDTGGSNVQFAVDPGDGRMVLIEMNPRVSRSSALASKATGFPIAKIAAMLAVGFTLDEIPNDITGQTLAAFEPALDYVAVKVPRWAFEKFPEADQVLTTRMKSVGEVMAIGRTFPEALGKAFRALERDFDLGPAEDRPIHPGDIGSATENRLLAVERALAEGYSVESLATASGIDPWFVDQVGVAGEHAAGLRGRSLANISREQLREAKRAGLSDRRIAGLVGSTEAEIRARRRELGVVPVFKTVDTCAGEFAAQTPYYYSAYEEESEVEPADRPRVVILGAGPNRIGQGIEFDYACVQAAFALRDAGFETVMINSNPETVSTDYDTSDRLYFEPLTVEDVLAVCDAEQPVGVIVQLGGQTPLAMAAELEREGIRILGTDPAALDTAEDRAKFGALLRQLDLPTPSHGQAASSEEARLVAKGIGYPLVVRPSYVLGGRAMGVVYTEEELDRFVGAATAASPDHPLFLDRFLEGAIEVDVDLVADDERVLIGAVMEHIEEAGVHSGDSSCVIPPSTLTEHELDQIEETATLIARRLRVRGLLNVQLAVRDDVVYVLEANPRASRTVPFVAKATGVRLATAAARIMAGETLPDLQAVALVPERPVYRHLDHVAVKGAVLPFGRFPGVDTVLGPEMRSTGEVMGIAPELGVALARAQEATGAALPISGTVFISAANRDKRSILLPGRRLWELGFTILATRGTADCLERSGVTVTTIRKRSEGSPNAEDLIAEGQVDLVLNTPFGRGARTDGYYIRTAAAARGIPCITTVPGILAAVQGIEALRHGRGVPRPLQEYHAAPPPVVVSATRAPEEVRERLVAVNAKETG
jgi:carbamoyl-phosphate synthase large subunit